MREHFTSQKLLAKNCKNIKALENDRNCKSNFQPKPLKRENCEANELYENLSYKERIDINPILFEYTSNNPNNVFS